MNDFKISTGCIARINQISMDIRLISKDTCRKPTASTGEFSSAKTYTVDQFRIQLMDLWLTPNDRYFNECKNAVTLCDSGAFTIPTKRKVADK
ncbi:hypothetical protein MXB_2094, partial [Myxobolus squamalis]